VAASGGADSTALLVGLASVAREFGLELCAAHVHHGLRGAEADGDLEFVQALCARLEVPFEAMRRRQGREDAGRPPGEAQLRAARRKCLEATARRMGATAIATGHTADDQLETMLMRLARGTGLKGLGSIAPAAPPFVRPLLEATRLEVERDLRAAGIRWREDSTNASRAYLRNRLRHDVVPALVAAIAGAGASPEARARLARRAAATTADVRAGARLATRLAGAEHRRRTTVPVELTAGWGRTDEATREFLRRRSPDMRLVSLLETSGWARLETAVRHATLDRWWTIATGRLHGGLTRRHRDALDALLCGPRRRGQISLPDGWLAVLDRPRLRLFPSGLRPGTGQGPADGKLPRAAGRAATPAPVAPSPRPRAAGRTSKPSIRSRRPASRMESHD